MFCIFLPVGVASEQPDGVLVHGGLRAAQLPGQQAGVLQHVRAPHLQRPVRRLHCQGHQTHEVPLTRTHQSPQR